MIPNFLLCFMKSLLIINYFIVFLATCLENSIQQVKCSCWLLLSEAQLSKNSYKMPDNNNVFHIIHACSLQMPVSS